MQFDHFRTHDQLSIRWGAAEATSSTVRGAILFLNGRTEYMEKYAEVSDELNGRGFNVFSCDWRGQGLSDRLLTDSRKGHVASFDDYLDDMDPFMEILAQRSNHPPLILLGHSMGGHIALRLLTRHPGRFDKVVLTSPMIDIRRPALLPRGLLRGMVRAAAGKALQSAFVPGSGGAKGRDYWYEGNHLTSDRSRFERNLAMIRRDPRLAVGGVTFGWLNAALDSIAVVRTPAFARALALPLMMVTASQERIVCSQAQEAFCHLAPDCRIVCIEGARHELLVETDERREQFWQAFDKFISA